MQIVSLLERLWRHSGAAAARRIAVLLVLAVSAPAPALAQSSALDTADLRRVFVPFTEIRGTLPGTAITVEDHLWRFYADGRMTGVFTGLRNTFVDSYTVEDNDTGRWSIEQSAQEGGLLCVQWQRWYRGRRICFSIIADTGKWHRFLPVGYGPAFRGTIDTFRP